MIARLSSGSVRIDWCNPYPSTSTAANPCKNRQTIRQSSGGQPRPATRGLRWFPGAAASGAIISAAKACLELMDQDYATGTVIDGGTILV
jgi:hypothetical protein